MSPSTRTAAYLAVVLSLLVAAYACAGGGFAVGSVRERDTDRPTRSEVQSLRLELVTSFQSNDSPSPAWSPDGSMLVYAERYAGTVFSYSLGDTGSSLVYQGSSAQATLPEAAYNVDAPAFLNDHEIVTGPAYPYALDDAYPYGNALRIDVNSSTAQLFGNLGRAPQVNAARDRVLLEASDGLRMTDLDGNELSRFRSLCWARWAPSGNEFVALQYTSYCGESSTLVRVTEDGTVQKLHAGAYEPAWHPDGSGIAFTRPTSGRSWFDPAWEYGAVAFYDFETGKVRTVADNARSPAFLSEPPLLLFDSMSGVGITDFEETRVLRDVRLGQLRPSPDGQHLAGVRASTATGGYYYYPMDVVIYALTTD